MRGRALLASSLLFACQPASPAQPPAERGDPAPAASTTPEDLPRRLASLGDGATLVLILRPDRWAPAKTEVEALFKYGMPGSSLLTGGTVEASLLAGARELGLDPHGELQGLDRSRTVLISLGEPPVDGPPLVAHTAIGLLAGTVSPGRVQALLPAKDAARLLASIQASLGDAGTQLPQLVEAKGQAFARFVPGEYPDATIVAAWVDGADVRVVLLHGLQGIDPKRAHVVLRRMLETDPEPVRAGPALAFAMNDAAPVTGIFRPLPWRSFYYWKSLGDGRRAIDTSPADQRGMAAMRSISIAGAAPAHMSSQGAETGRWGLSVEPGDGGLQVKMVGELTSLGRGLLDGATTEHLEQRQVAGKVNVRVESELSAAILGPRLGPAPEAFPELSTKDRDRYWRNCGFGCTVWALALRPISSTLRGTTPAGPEVPSGSRGPRLRALARDGGDALTVTMAVGPRDAETDPVPPELDARFEGSPPVVVEVDPAEACHQRLARHYVLHDQLYRLPPEEQQVATRKHTRDLLGQLECPDVPDETVLMVSAWDWGKGLVRNHLARGQIDEARREAQLLCSSTEDPVLCGLQRELEAVPDVEILKPKMTEGCAVSWKYSGMAPSFGLLLVVTREGAWLGERRLELRARDIAEAIVEEMGAVSSWDPAASPDHISLLVEPDLPLSEVRPAIEALAATGATRLRFAYIQHDRRVEPSPGTGAPLLRMDPPFELRPTPPAGYRDPEAEYRREPSSEGLYDVAGVGRPPGTSILGARRKDPEPVQVVLEGKTVTLIADGGLKVSGSIDQLDSMLAKVDAHDIPNDDPYGEPDEWRKRERLLRVSAGTPWSSLVQLHGGLCEDGLVLQMD